MVEEIALPAASSMHRVLGQSIISAMDAWATGGPLVHKLNGGLHPHNANTHKHISSCVENPQLVKVDRPLVL